MIDTVEAKVEDALSAPEASEEAESPSKSEPQEETSDDINAAMLKYLETGDQEEDPEPAQDAKAQKADGDKPDAEAKADESEEDADAEVEAKSDDKSDGPAKKKPSGWQRSKARYEKRIAKLEAEAAKAAEAREQFEKREREWEHVTQTLMDRYEDAERRLGSSNSQLQDLGVGPSPEAQRVAELERQLREQAAAIERQAREQELKAEREAQRRQAQVRAQVEAQVNRVAEQYGLDPDDLADRTAAHVHAARYRNRKPPSLEDVAKELRSLRDMQEAQSIQRQTEVSSTAPRKVGGRQASVARPSFAPNTSGMVDFLKSEGY